MKATAATLRRAAHELGPARRHIARIMEGQLPASPGVLGEASASIERCIAQLKAAEAAAEALGALAPTTAAAGTRAPLSARDRQMGLALWKAWAELNAIRARDGVPFTHLGCAADVHPEVFGATVDEVGAAIEALTGSPPHPWPPLFEAEDKAGE